MFDFTIKQLMYNDRVRSLTVSASGVVQSNKFYPVFALDGKEFIFKPISQSKPLATAFFPLAECFWSEILERYFPFPAVSYQRAVCKGYHEAEPKYLNEGCLSMNVLVEGEKLVNLHEYFQEHPDPSVNIQYYKNYCLMYYDFVPIFRSELFMERRDLAEQLAMQILESMLVGNENFHYENVAFICDQDGNVLRLCPPLDNEFSLYFLFPDDLERQMTFFRIHLQGILGNALDEDDALTKSSFLFENLQYIHIFFPQVVEAFVKGLQRLQKDLTDELLLQELEASLDEQSISCDSCAWRVGRARYHDKDEIAAQRYERQLHTTEVDLKVFWRTLSAQLAAVIKALRSALSSYTPNPEFGTGFDSDFLPDDF